MRVKLTEKEIRKLHAPTKSEKQEVAWDTETKGFGVLCSGVTSTKTFIVQRDVKGKNRRITVAAVGEVSLAQAREEAKNTIHDLRLGKDPKARGAANATLSEALELYVENKRTKKGAKLRPRTAELYRDCLRYLKKLAALPLRNIDLKMVTEQYAHISKQFGQGAANNAMRVLRAVCNHMKLKGELNPVQLGGLWVDLKPRQGHIKGDDLPAFYKAVCGLPNPVAADYIKLLLFTGLRRRTAAGLRWEDVDFANAVVCLPAASMKSGRTFDLTMTDLVRDLLIARRQIGGEWVFPSDSKSGHIEEPKFAFKQIEDACGIKVLDRGELRTACAHDMRRTFSTVARRCVSGIAKKVLLNHSIGNDDVTENYEMYPQEEADKDAQKVADRLGELCQISRPEGGNILPHRAKGQ